MSKIELRDFDGDLDALWAMTREPFSTEYGQETWVDLYRPKLARHLFAGIPDPRFLIGAYDGAKLVGFVANLPRRYRFGGQIYLGVVSTMLVTHRGYRGATLFLISECLRRNEEYGADLALMIFEKDHSARFLFQRYLKPRYRIERLKTMYALVRAVDLDKIVDSQNLSWLQVAGVRLFGAHRPPTAPPISGLVRPYKAKDLAEILALTERYSARDALVRIFDAESLARQLDTEGVTSTVVYECDNAVEGFINIAVHEYVAQGGTHRWAWLDFLYWDGLSTRTRGALLAGAWQMSRKLGCIGIMEWNKGYYAKGTLFRSRFLPYPRFLEVNAWIFHPHLSLRGVGKIVEQVV